MKEGKKFSLITFFTAYVGKNTELLRNYFFTHMYHSFLYVYKAATTKKITTYAYPNYYHDNFFPSRRKLAIFILNSSSNKQFSSIIIFSSFLKNFIIQFILFS